MLFILKKNILISFLNNLENYPTGIGNDSSYNFFYLKEIIYATSGYFLYLAIKKTFSKKFNPATINYEIENQQIINELRINY